MERLKFEVEEDSDGLVRVAQGRYALYRIEIINGNERDCRVEAWTENQGWGTGCLPESFGWIGDCESYAEESEKAFSEEAERNYALEWKYEHDRELNRFFEQCGF